MLCHSVSPGNVTCIEIWNCLNGYTWLESVNEDNFQKKGVM